MLLLSAAVLLGSAIANASATGETASDRHHSRSANAGKDGQPTSSQQPQQGVASTTSSSNPAQERTVPASSFPKWEEPILKGVAEGGLALVSLGFAAFTFLYGALLSLRVSDEESDERLTTLKAKLRHALYSTAVAVLLSAVLSVLAFISIASERHILGLVAIALTVVVLLLLSGITGYLAYDVYGEGKTL